MSDGTRYFEKDNVIVSDCYALNDGVIHYKETKEGDTEVWIGDTQYDYNSECMYYFLMVQRLRNFKEFPAEFAI